jgi:hypothetical protein
MDDPVGVYDDDDGSYAARGLVDSVFVPDVAAGGPDERVADPALL